MQLDAKNKARQSEVDKGNEDELTEFDVKKQEKEKRVEELRAQLSELKAKEDEKRGNNTTNLVNWDSIGDCVYDKIFNSSTSSFIIHSQVH